MQLINLQDLNEKEAVPGYKAKIIHTDNMTIAYLTVESGATSPEHSHPNEQVTTVTEGKFELTIEGEPVILEPGLIVIIPPNIVHSGKAITNCCLVDTFYPIREDFRSK
jgi:quercetin dioxygenase-like cupin family protein